MPCRRAWSHSASNSDAPTRRPFASPRTPITLEPQSRLAAPELAFEHPREDVADETLAVGRRELRMQVRLAQRRVESPFEIGAARVPFGSGVDRDHGVEIVRA